MVKFAASSIQGVAQNAIATNSPGTALTVNPGPGSYPVNALLGTAGTTFDHSTATPAGNRGVMYQAGTDLSNPSIAAAGSATSPTGFLGTVTTSGTINFTALVPTAIYVYAAISGGGYTVTVNGITLPNSTLQLNPNPSGVSGGINCLTPIFLSAGQVFSFVFAATGSASVFAQKVN
jgi:hypothetical protein